MGIVSAVCHVNKVTREKKNKGTKEKEQKRTTEEGTGGIREHGKSICSIPCFKTR